MLQRAISELAARSDGGVSAALESVDIHFRAYRYQVPTLNHLIYQYKSLAQGLRYLIDDWGSAQGVSDPQGRLIELETEMKRIANEMSAVRSRIETTRNKHAIETIHQLEAFADRFPELTPTQVLDRAKSVIQGFQRALREIHQSDQWFVDQIITHRENGITYADRIGVGAGLA